MPRDNGAAHQSVVQVAKVNIPHEHAQIAQKYLIHSCDLSHELMSGQFILIVLLVNSPDNDAAHQSVVQVAKVNIPHEHAQIAQKYLIHSCDLSHELMPGQCILIVLVVSTLRQ